MARALIIALTIVYVACFVVITWPQPGYSRDVSSFLASGQAAAAGRNPYGIYPLTHRSEVRGTIVPFPNLNPPVTVLAFEAIALLPPLLLYRLWYVASLALYLLIIWLLARAYPALTGHRRLAWALCMTGLWTTLASGQLYIALAAATAGAWLALKSGRRFIGSILIGFVVAIKPNLLVWPALMILAGEGLAGLIALASAAVISSLPLLRYGPSIYAQWFAAVRGVGWTALTHNMSVFGVAARLDLPWLGPLLAVLLLAALAWWARRRRPPALVATGPAIIGSFLASPLAWPSFLVLLVPALWARRWSRGLAVGALSLLFPSLLIIYFGDLSTTGNLAAGLAYPAALAILLFDLVRRGEAP